MHRKVYQTRSLNSRERVKYIIWTNEMDRCLFKILVEHAKKGYKSDNIINSATYAAAVAALNEKFRLDLTKDHIKNRLKTWRKQYAVLKEILAQKGFKWDKARKMVVATDAMWNDYIKVHPDSKPFRTKIFENYDELRIVVGNDQAITSCSDHGDEIDVDLMSDNEVVEAAIDSEIQSDDKQAKNLRWTKEMDTCLSKILVEQVQNGYKIDNILQPEAYDAAVTALNEKFGPDLTKDHIRNRLKTLKKQYGVLKELLSHTGFKWDETQKMILGNDSMWNDYIKTHHDARLFKGRVVENYDNLCIIFGTNHATGSFSRTADDIVHSLACDSEGVEAINASPIRCWGSMKDQAKNMRWTNEMDHCLSMILVEQVKLGNKSKFDNKFNPVAYVAAVSTLNERFQHGFTKDHVKNRTKTWKKLYGIVKELLQQSEFKWDKNQKMVVANDSVWHDHIKKNPDARLLQGRVIENYDDLCVIIGNDDPNESSRSDAEADLDCADNGGESEFAYQNQSNNAKEKGKYVIWTKEMDNCLTEKLIEQVKLWNNLEKSFTTVSYTAALTALNKTFALDFTKECIRNHLKTWKKLYELVKEVLSNRGFEWDENQQMIVADDFMWNDYIKEHPDAKFLWGRSIENYTELHLIGGNSHATGCWSITGAKGDVHLTCNNGEHVETLLQNTVMNEEMSQDNTGERTQGSSQQTRARPSSSSRSKQQPSKKRRGSDAMVEMMSAMATNIGRIADALTASNQNVCLDQLFEMVQNIPGFDDDLIVEACEFLSFDEKRAKMFLKLDDRLRKLWLLKRLRGHSS